MISPIPYPPRLSLSCWGSTPSNRFPHLSFPTCHSDCLYPGKLEECNQNGIRISLEIRACMNLLIPGRRQHHLHMQELGFLVTLWSATKLIPTSSSDLSVSWISLQSSGPRPLGLTRPEPYFT